MLRLMRRSPRGAGTPSRAQRLHLSGLAMVMMAAALWATVGVASQLFPQDSGLPLEAYGLARTAVAGPALLLLACFTAGNQPMKTKPGSLSGFLTFGVCCAIFQIGLFRSFALLGVTVTVFITVCLPPVLAVVWAMWRDPAGVSRNVVTALLMAISGLIFFSRSGLLDQHPHEIFAGFALSIIASIAFVAMSNAARALSLGHAPLVVSGLGLTVASMVLAPVVLLSTPAAAISLATALSDWKTATFLLYLGLVPTALAYLLYCAGMARCRSAPCGLVASMIEPAVAAGLAYVLLSEYLGPWEVLGCAMLFLAMLTLWRGEQKLAAEAG